MSTRRNGSLAFLVKDLEISLCVLIFLLCDRNEFGDAFFSWKAWANIKDDFGAEITKIKNKTRLKSMISSAHKSMRHCWKSFAYCIIVLCEMF